MTSRTKKVTGISIGSAVAGVALITGLGQAQIKLLDIATDDEVAAAVDTVRAEHRQDMENLYGLLVCIYRDIPPVDCPALEAALNH